MIHTLGKREGESDGAMGFYLTLQSEQNMHWELFFVHGCGHKPL
jgi:hypothetical protein